MHLRIDRHGQIHCLYSEVVDLASFGQLSIQRASRVEPDDTGQWWADLSPVGGTILGPFRLRSEALAAEASWLETHWLSATTAPSSPSALAPPCPGEDAHPPDGVKVVAIVEGGVVQSALGSRPDIEFEVLDRDNYDCQEEIAGETEDEAEERLTRECPHTIS